MLSALNKPRSPSFYHGLMFKIAITVGLLYFFWEPLRPVRHVTADALSFTAEQIRR
jgi:hypothetical protein